MIIARVGDIVKYNGYMPDHIGSDEANFIDDLLEIGKSYKVIKVWNFLDDIWYYKIDSIDFLWVPIESFDITKRKFRIAERYDLR